MNFVVVGAQWGDEGKGKLIDFLSDKVDVTVRYQGGNNAGHTVVVDDEEYIFHLLPSAILHQQKICVIANGVVIDPLALIQEIRDLKKRGVAVNAHQLKVAGNAHVVMPYHRILDGLRESRRNNKIGTTGRGIGPCYADKSTRCGIRMIDLMNARVFKSKLEDNLREKNEIFKKVYRHPEYSLEGIYQEYLRFGRFLKPYVCDTAIYLNKVIENKKTILFEGAQGTFLDIDFGTYPFVTSSNSIVGGVCPGSGVPPTKIDKAIAVVKAYTTRVGEGPFPTEFAARFMDAFRLKGKEFGATTGRARRCGWFDSVLVRYALMVNGVSELAIMKLDVLDGLKKIKICTAYKYRGRLIKDFPLDLEVLCRAKPVYEDMDGWLEPSKGLKRFDELPIQAKAYLRRLEDLLKVRIRYISTGSKRDETIVLPES
ncbi:MAG TPA: adenylosuccinate synthase [Candidatus Omnitrophota bacterium]|nr:adenylosuccinate synthase [Candidatus Omnitrophota bacterium]HQO57331.1 adenylosuccinate synthase [Candidatus Omnitrophota bacterium]HQP11694.1 adenylosuccinate synthase [Candidatus Omnitrophota bacterium]